MKWILVLSLLFSLTSFAQISVEEVDFRKALKEANQEILKVQNQRSCSGVKLSLTCGNGICNKNEDRNNCAADCVKGKIRAYNHQTICEKVKRVFRPENTDDVKDAIQYALDHRQKVRVVGQLHSANNQLCSDGIVLSTEKLRNVHGLSEFNGEEVVSVDGGVTLGELSAWLHDKDKSLGYTLIGFRGVSVAGSTATGSHGSSPKHNSVLASLIREMTVVTADAKVHYFSKHNTTPDQWKSLRTSLGMLGVVVKMKLKVIPQFNLHMRVSYDKIDKLLKDGDVAKEMAGCDWGQINWFPGTKKFLKACAYKTNAPADKGATNTLLLPDIPDFIIKPFKVIMQFGACNNKIKCLIEKVRYLQFKWAPYFKKENKKGKLVSSKDLIGPSHLMTSSDFTEKAGGFFQMDWEIAVPASELSEAMRSVQAHVEKNKICLPLVGIFVRFSRVGDETLMAHSSVGGSFKKGELVAFIEMPVYLPVGFSRNQARAYDKIYEDFAKLLVNKHKGRAHWAKNRNWIFPYQKNLGRMNENTVRFKKIVRQMDPNGLFRNKFSDIIGI
ncbi:MAG: FAD-binding protein [Bacteriovoracaceae bacterium]|nr:FAD-binding protein [Bacteriovoracaceae bacterium]